MTAGNVLKKKHSHGWMKREIWTSLIIPPDLFATCPAWILFIIHIIIIIKRHHQTINTTTIISSSSLFPSSSFSFLSGHLHYHCLPPSPTLPPPFTPHPQLYWGLHDEYALTFPSKTHKNKNSIRCWTNVSASRLVSLYSPAHSEILAMTTQGAE